MRPSPHQDATTARGRGRRLDAITNRPKRATNCFRKFGLRKALREVTRRTLRARPTVGSPGWRAVVSTAAALLAYFSPMDADDAASVGVGFPPPRPELVALATALPPNVKFGTSSWSSDGWAGDVYHRSYRNKGPTARLEEYVRYPLFRLVGINTAFYESHAERILDGYARLLPPGFGCDVKVWDRITARRFIRDRRWGQLAGQLNPDFLNAPLFLDSVLARYARAFSRQALCFVFQFQAMRGTDLLGATEWAERLDPVSSHLPPRIPS